MNTSVLIIDDNRVYLESIQAFLKARRVQVDILQNPLHLEAKLHRSSYHCIVLDLVMPGMDGEKTLELVQKIAPEIPVVLNSGASNIETAVRCIKKGAFHFIEKSESPESLLQLIHLAQRQYRRTYEEIEAYRLIGSSKSMEKLRGDINKVADSSATVLILGESGTGKEHVAGLLHYLSSRANEPFVTLNCAAISENLIESELFGHVKGAFTGAIRDQDGAFIAAHGGTLFLDEIGDLPQSAQTKLLRVLGSGEIKRVGDAQTRTVDVRIVAATNQDLSELIRAGTFREELFYRLNQLVLRTPPLRDHPEDIPELSEHFLPVANRKNNRYVAAFAKDAMYFILRYRWPGNVRQLQSVILRAVAFAEGNEITQQDVSDALEVTENSRSSSPNQEQAKPIDVQPMEEAVNEFQRQYVIAALYACGGRKGETAEKLGLSRQTFYRLMEKLDLSNTDFKPGN
ncbi:MAG: sigma-54-dependent transcriptional regulator [Calditrichia bacterium]